MVGNAQGERSVTFVQTEDALTCMFFFAKKLLKITCFPHLAYWNLANGANGGYCSIFASFFLVYIIGFVHCGIPCTLCLLCLLMLF